jgi:hypothetical protein
MGVTWAGWSETMDGVLIPMPPPPSRGTGVDKAFEEAKIVRKRLTGAAMGAPAQSERHILLTRAVTQADQTVEAIKKVPFI